MAEMRPRFGYRGTYAKRQRSKPQRVTRWTKAGPGEGSSVMRHTREWRKGKKTNIRVTPGGAASVLATRRPVSVKALKEQTAAKRYLGGLSGYTTSQLRRMDPLSVSAGYWGERGQVPPWYEAEGAIDSVPRESAGSSGQTEWGPMELTPEEAERIQQAIDQLQYGQSARLTGRAGQLALEAAESPGMTDEEREALYREIVGEQIVPGFAAERFTVAEAGGPGARQRLGELRLGETGERIKLASELGKEQLRTRREERGQAIGTLGSVAGSEASRIGDIVSTLLQYGTTPGHQLGKRWRPGRGLTYAAARRIPRVTGGAGSWSRRF